MPHGILTEQNALKKSSPGNSPGLFWGIFAESVDILQHHAILLSSITLCPFQIGWVFRGKHTISGVQNGWIAAMLSGN
ncbi:MAG: hypothetical protein QM218_05190 [Candidatus Cloacimonadota bacterium]|jgi:hypothetical protein|nr:hypothetical protein [Candidatus Cloacimonadota bacterium]